MTRTLTLYIGARTVSVLGNALGPVALTFAVLALPDVQPSGLSIVLAAMATPRIVLMLFGGVIGDRLPRRQVLIGAELAGAAAYLAMTLLVLTGRATVTGLAVCAVCAGSASAMLLPSLSGMMAEITEPESRQRANAQLRLGTNTATVAGFALGGLLIAWLGPGWALACDAVTFVLAAALLAAMRLPAGPRPAGRRVFADLRTGWQEFVRRKWLWTIVLAAALINAAVGVTLSMAGPLLAQARLGGAAAWSWVLAGYALGMLLGVTLAMRIKVARPLRTAVLTATLLGLPAAMLGVAAPLPVVVAGAVVAGVAFDVFGVLWETTVQSEVPREAMSRVAAYEWLGAVGLTPLAMLAAGLVIGKLGTQSTLLGLAGVIVMAALAPLASAPVRHYER